MVAIRSKRKAVMSDLYWWPLCAGLTLTGDPTFRDEDEERRVWFSLRESILHDFVRDYPGQRPVAWWKFEKNLSKPPADQAAVLREMGELSKLEELALRNYEMMKNSPELDENLEEENVN